MTTSKSYLSSLALLLLVMGALFPSSVEALTTTTTKTGLKITDLVEGDGPTVGTNDFVQVHFEGKLQNGKVFATSRPVDDMRVGTQKGAPLSFPLGRGKVIAGWDEGLPNMKVGGKRRLVIPPELAYGDKGSPDEEIKPGSTLTFDIEMVSIDGSMDAAGGLGGGFAFALGIIAVNGLTELITGHELREYLNGSVM